MSNAEQSPEVVEEVIQEQEPNWKELAEKYKADLEKVAAHKDKLYQETKKAKADREAAELEKQRIAEEQAKKNGEFEKLWQTASQEKESLAQEIKNLKQSYRNEKIEVQAMRIANDLADGDNAVLLKKFVQENLTSLADDDGSLSEDVIKAVSNEFKNNQMYKALLKGSKASGGGATGNNKPNQSKQSMSRAEWSKLDPVKQAEFVKAIRAGQAELTDN